MKKIVSIFLCVIILLCFVACGEKSNTDKQSTEGTNQSESNSTENSITNTQSTESTNQNETDSIENTDHNTESTESTNENGTNNQEIAIFNTKNIKRITFYAYYGSGKGSDVPAEHLGEITTWLNSFKIDTDREFPDLVPPGTNTIHVEIEYLDGTVVKEGLDTATVDGITYYIKGDTAPKSYEEIISKTSLN
ncbi:MAG: hypothetical protein IJY83_02735 [Oscillospiraceae bacterium]|nr:hypothetical protein [Oscillospiraceae bacterium]